MRKIFYFALGAIFFGGIAFAQSIPSQSPFFYDGSNNITQIKVNTPFKLTGPTPGGCLQLTSGNIATSTGVPCGSGSGSVTAITAGTGLTGGTITTSGTISLSVPVSPTNGGTGTSTPPTFGQLLVGNAGGTYTLTATSSLGLESGSGSIGPGTTGQNAYYSGTNTISGTSTLFISSASHVGVGTVSPTSGTLQVNSTVGANTTPQLWLESTGNFTGLLLNNTSAGGNQFAIYSTGTGGGNTPNDFAIRNVASNKYPFTVSAVNDTTTLGGDANAGSADMTLLQGGNVGVGTSTPTALLSVAPSNTFGTSNLLQIGTTTNPVMTIFNHPDDTTFQQQIAFGSTTPLYNGSPVGGVYGFYTTQNAPQDATMLLGTQANQTAIVLDAGLNNCCGTPTSWAIEDFAGNTANFGNGLTFRNGGTGGTIPLFFNSSNDFGMGGSITNSALLGAQAVILHTGFVGIGSTTPEAILSVVNSATTAANTPLFEVASTTNGTATSTLFKILNNGNVGIASSTPWQALSISGNESLTGAFYDSTASAGANGNVLTSTGTATKWVATSTLSASLLSSYNNLTAIAGATTITTFTPTATSTVRVGAYINVTAVTLDVAQVQVTYTDENNSSVTANFFPQGLTSANIASTGDFSLPPQDIRVKANTLITLKTILTTGTGSIAYDVGGTIQQLTTN